MASNERGGAPSPVLQRRSVVSHHQPDGMILSTGNLYFTSHDASGACVFRMAQTARPGDEILLYKEPPGNRFGDIVFANVRGSYFGYFFTENDSGKSFIKRVPLTGSPAATVLTPPLDNIDIVNSHRNLATDGVSLFWQDVSSIKRMPIGGGPITTLDPTDANTPTAGVYLNRGNIVYASVNAVRFVPTGGAMTSPLVRTIAYADTTVTTILPVANGVYWGERTGAVRLKVGSTIHTLQEAIGKVPTSMGSNGFTAGAAVAWTQCASSTCQMRLDFPVLSSTFAVGTDALGASVTSAGDVFWGDSIGVHRLDF